MRGSGLEDKGEHLRRVCNKDSCFFEMVFRRHTVLAHPDVTHMGRLVNLQGEATVRLEWE